MSESLPVDSVNPEALEPFSRTQLIVADLDGTLLDPTWSIIDLIQAQIPRLRHRGIRFTIATGRAFRGVAQILPRLGLTASTPLAIYNGSLCIDAAGRHVISSSVIPADIAVRAVEWGLRRGLPVLCYPQLISRAVELHEAPIGFSCDGSPSNFAEPNGYDIRWYSLQSVDIVPDCLAMLVDLRGADSGNIDLDTIQDLTGVTATQSGRSFLEIRPAGCDKGTAISFIADRLRLPLTAVLAIGDNDNDIEMLKTAGIGVAVGNASRNLQAIASHSTPLPAAQGCLQVIRLVIDAHRYRTRVNKRIGHES